eukprot:15334449-Ditylum_brightwellii.AAC.1
MGVEAVGIMLVSHRPVRPRPPLAWCRQRQLTSEFTFIPFDDSKGVSHHWDRIRAYCHHDTNPDEQFLGSDGVIVSVQIKLCPPKGGELLNESVESALYFVGFKHFQD